MLTLLDRVILREWFESQTSQNSRYGGLSKSRELATKSREYALKRKYNLTLEQYNEILRSQDGRCGVCRRRREEFKTNFCVDHDHRTLEVRGLLCTNCNRYIIGRWRDPVVFENAASYLRGPFTQIYANKIKKRRKRRKKS